MSLTKVVQQPLKLSDAGKRDVRTQFGALCWRRREKDIQVLLVTSRTRKRWIIPKGWPVNDATAAEAAATEAWEEAGAEGKVSTACLGIYSYSKDLDSDERVPCVVAVFPMKVKKTRGNWPEKAQRRRRWFSLKKAASLVDETELASILRNFDPARL